MPTELTCKICRKIICEDIERIKDVYWIICPYYSHQAENPVYEGEN